VKLCEHSGKLLTLPTKFVVRAEQSAWFVSTVCVSVHLDSFEPDDF